MAKRKEMAKKVPAAEGPAAEALNPDDGAAGGPVYHDELPDLPQTAAGAAAEGPASGAGSGEELSAPAGGGDCGGPEWVAAEKRAEVEDVLRPAPDVGAIVQGVAEVGPGRRMEAVGVTSPAAILESVGEAAPELLVATAIRAYRARSRKAGAREVVGEVIDLLDRALLKVQQDAQAHGERLEI